MYGTISLCVCVCVCGCMQKRFSTREHSKISRHNQMCGTAREIGFRSAMMMARSCGRCGGAALARGLSSLPYPRAAVAITVMRRSPSGSGWEYLLAQRGKPPGMGSWSLPGGKIELGETVFHAAARELHEETDLEPPCVKFYPWPIAWTDVIVEAEHSSGVGGSSKTPVTEQQQPLAYHYVLTQLFAFADASARPTSGDDVSAVRWCSLDEALSGDIPLHGADVTSVLRRAEHLLQTGAMTPDEAVEV